METKKTNTAANQPTTPANESPSATDKKPGKITGVALLASLILLLMIIFLFTLTMSGKWIKLSGIMETCPISVGFCMNKAGAGFFRIFAYVVPVLWILALIFAFIKRNISIVLTVIGTIGYILLGIFATTSVNKLFPGNLSCSLNFAFFLTIALAIIAIVCLAKKPKNK